MDRAQERHVLGLDLIRFAAATLVMGFHYGHDIGLIPLSWAGWVGVEVFFVISGYVIAASSEGSTPGRFARNRVVRLMPTVWLCSTAVALVCALQGTYPDLAARYLRSMTLWPTGTWVDGVLWTLPVEIVFYAIVFLCMLSKAPLGVLLRGLAVASAIYWTLRSASQFHLTTVADSLSEPFVTLSMLGFGCYFAVGGLMREALTKGLSLERCGFLALGFAAGGAQIAFAASNWAPACGAEHVGKIVPLLIWPALVGLMVVSIKGNTLAWRLFGPAAPLIRLFGLATYPLYLLHESAGNALKWVPVARTPLIASVLAIGLSLAFAATLEPWAQRGLRWLLRPGRIVPQPAFQLEDEPS